MVYTIIMMSDDGRVFGVHFTSSSMNRHAAYEEAQSLCKDDSKIIAMIPGTHTVYTRECFDV
jgi:hypothetical protein